MEPGRWGALLPGSGVLDVILLEETSLCFQPGLSLSGPSPSDIGSDLQQWVCLQLSVLVSKVCTSLHAFGHMVFSAGSAFTLPSASRITSDLQGPRRSSPC